MIDQLSEAWEVITLIPDCLKGQATKCMQTTGILIPSIEAENNHLIVLKL